MFLESLTIKNDEEVIREISFHKGINLIVDETTSDDRTETGNNVGKTTVLRLIDFCLYGSGQNIYTDSEFKTTNQNVESFLKENNIIITLTLSDQIGDENSPRIVIERNFLKHGEKIQRIDGQKMSNTEFSSTLKHRIFKTKSDRPTFKQLKSKNIRDEKNKLVQTIKVLNSFTTDVAYESLHLFWFGVDVDLSKDKLVRDKNLEEKLQARLRKDSNLSQIKQSLIIVDKEILSLNRKRINFNLNEEYEADLNRLNGVKLALNSTSNTLSHLEMRVELIEESRRDLENSSSSIDAQKIEALYKSAKALIPNIQRTFEDTLKFHNDMISQKMRFITEDLPQLKAQISKERMDLEKFLTEEKVISEKLDESKTIEDLEVIILDLNKYHERKGALEEQKRLWDKTNLKLSDIDEKLNLINAEIDSKDAFIQKRIAEFNSYFSDISNRLNGEHSLLSAENVDGVYKFAIGNIEGNLGTGGKKSQMAAFDLSYIKFADEKDIPCLHFILQDQIENVHSNQITNLLTEIVDEVNCQYVLPVLRDKLPDEIDIKKLEVLSLSQEKKLFKI
jgi:uncharacterized protein YydD (DUF2326 family)